MIDLEELARFLVKAKKEAYAGDGKEIVPERPGFKELEFSEGDWNYRDSYVGFFRAPGQEVVRFQRKPVWAMSYDGGMLSDYRNNVDHAKEVFGFLKRVLLQVSEDAPYRGPRGRWSDRIGWHYENLIDFGGDITDFRGHEAIWVPIDGIDKKVFSQNYIGGWVIPK